MNCPRSADRRSRCLALSAYTPTDPSGSSRVGRAGRRALRPRADLLSPSGSFETAGPSYGDMLGQAVSCRPRRAICCSCLTAQVLRIQETLLRRGSAAGLVSSVCMPWFGCRERGPTEANPVFPTLSRLVAFQPGARSFLPHLSRYHLPCFLMGGRCRSLPTRRCRRRRTVFLG